MDQERDEEEVNKQINDEQNRLKKISDMEKELKKQRRNKLKEVRLRCEYNKNQKNFRENTANNEEENKEENENKKEGLETKIKKIYPNNAKSKRQIQLDNMITINPDIVARAPPCAVPYFNWEHVLCAVQDHADILVLTDEINLQVGLSTEIF